MGAGDFRLHYISWFFGGAFFTNAVPHLVSGLMGRPFQSPFAEPPGKGLSSSTVNAAWGAFNIVIACLLLFRVGGFDPRAAGDAAAAGSGALLMALLLARAFGRFHGDNHPPS